MYESLSLDQKKLKTFADQCVWLYIVYADYKMLYESGQDNLCLLKESSYQFFRDMQDVLSDYIHLRVCAISDAAQTQKRDNLTINNIWQTIAWPPNIRAELKNKIDQLNAFAIIVRPSRNRIIAHADLETSMSDTTLGGYDEGELDQFFENLDFVITRMHEHLFGGPFSIKVNEADGGASDLILRLREIRNLLHQSDVKTPA